MLDFAIFAVTFVVALIAAAFYLYPGSRKITTVPGPDSSDEKYGNIPDITKHGSMFEFLKAQHNKYGRIMSFWFYEQLVVSIYGPELFKECSALFDLPKRLFSLFQPLITEHSINLTNGAEARRRHKLYSKVLQNPTALRKYLDIINDECRRNSETLREVPEDEHISLLNSSIVLSSRMSYRLLFGFDKSAEEGRRLTENYRFIWDYLEKSLSPNFMQDTEQFERRKNEVHAAVKNSLENRVGKGDGLFVDVLLENVEEKEVQIADAVTMLVGGLHTTGTTITWALYFLMTNPRVKETLMREIFDVLGDDPIDFEKFNQLTYVKNVIKETLRLSKLATWSGRISNVEITLGGHKIPPNTPIMIANAVSHDSEEIWKDKDQFMPERFDENVEPFQFEPFGFAGKRKCPGHKLSMLEMTVSLTTLLRDFEWSLVPGHEKVGFKFGLVTIPDKEIWVTIKPRK
ncbi:DgyrCDS8193 [Dimorphilus gyrociliatus]|uniref:DgyrCDS8193 n=1 Tax=Dimorphilus gyrociliatus TaxID=2664684 RepID=A0A7I8VUE9_9ANNE|nr:DgyrCDS8193 [Dimorphilus gyrociliatus]